ncbi:MAG: nuclear transport factor 2 family protein [Pseudomonadales bacterium]|nr:nuclear transport factor 2 family protein [Pseudomonadales bacterium]MBO6566671.1 nuclear transport factor 2 family protein [Pseudomonadales bacterium]
MPKTLNSTRIVLLSIALFSNNLAFPSSEESEVTMVSAEFVQQYETALASHSWEKVSPLISERASVVFSNGTVHKGKEAVRVAYERNWKKITSESYEMTNVHWLLDSSDTAVYMFDFSWTGVIDGEATAGGGRGTAVIILENGKWQLLAEHLGYPEH